MVFALEMVCPATDGRSAARIEGEVDVTGDGNRILTNFPARGTVVAAFTCAEPTSSSDRPPARGMSRFPLTAARTMEQNYGAPASTAAGADPEDPKFYLHGRDQHGPQLVQKTAHVDTHVHSFETSFFILSGDPVLYLDGRGFSSGPAPRRDPGRVPHAWRSTARAMDPDGVAPASRAGTAAGHVLPRRPPGRRASGLDLRDPRNRNLFPSRERTWTSTGSSEGSKVRRRRSRRASRQRHSLYSGITVKMLVDKRLDAQLHTMFMGRRTSQARSAPAARPASPSEESYVDARGGGGRRRRRQPPIAAVPVTSSGPAVGLCVRTFYETKGGTVRWLETLAPGAARPPLRTASSATGSTWRRSWDETQTEAILQGRRTSISTCTGACA